MEQKKNNEQKADVYFVSQPIAKPFVVRSPKAVKKSITKDLSEMPYLDKEYLEKREQSYQSLIKMWGLDVP